MALLPPAGALAELEAVVGPQRTRWPGLRWTSELEASHVTLAFLGEVDEARVLALRTQLEGAADLHPSLIIRISGAGGFSSAVQARVLWAGLQGDLRALAALAASVAAGAGRAGCAPPQPSSRYHPHLTLAHCQERTDLRSLIQILSGFAGSTWTAGHVHLIRSQLGSCPRYDTVGSWPLRQ